MAEWGYTLAILPENMYRAYFLMDSLAEGAVNEICLAAAAQKIRLSRSADNHTAADSGCIHFSGNDIDRIKRLIAQCHLRPHDAGWLHVDLDAVTPQGEATSFASIYKTAGGDFP